VTGLTNSLLGTVPQTYDVTLLSFDPHDLHQTHCFTLQHFIPIHSTAD